MANENTSNETVHPLRAAVRAAEAELEAARAALEVIDEELLADESTPERVRVLARIDSAADALEGAREALDGSDCPRTWALIEDDHEYGDVVAASAKAALEEARSNVDRSNYADAEGTLYIRVAVRCDETGEHDSDNVTLEAEEPDCNHDDGHDWRSPYAVLGGLKENPGVWGNGGGVIIREVCAHCGAYKVTDTWAHHPRTGEQGLTSVKYEKADEKALDWVRGSKLETIREALEAAGYDSIDTADDTRLVLAVEDNGDDDPDADAALEAIRAIVEPLGAVADWSGSGNTDSDGYSTSDVHVEIA